MARALVLLLLLALYVLSAAAQDFPANVTCLQESESKYDGLSEIGLIMLTFFLRVVCDDVTFKKVRSNTHAIVSLSHFI